MRRECPIHKDAAMSECESDLERCEFICEAHILAVIEAHVLSVVPIDLFQDARVIVVGDSEVVAKQLVVLSKKELEMLRARPAQRAKRMIFASVSSIPTALQTKPWNAHRIL